MRIVTGCVLFAVGCGGETKEPAPDSDSPDTDCTLLVSYEDADGDGWGNADAETSSCVEPEGNVATPGDCDDADDSVNPDAEELCNDVDDNCDGVDDVYLTWFLDEDDDGYGIPGSEVLDCDQPDGYVELEGDCDDADPLLNPGEIDLCDGIDTDCDGVIDDGMIEGWALMSIDHVYSKVWDVDLASGALTEIGPLLVNNEAITASDSRDDGYTVVYDLIGRQILDVDPCTGVLTPIGATGESSICAIEFGASDVLYGINDFDDTLVSFDLTTGAATVIGNLGMNVGACGLAYDCATDTLYGMDATSRQVYEIDPSSAAVSGAVNITLPMNAPGLEFDPTLGLLHVTSGSAHYTLDPTTGTSDLLGAFTAGSSVDDLSFAPACP